jgi:hypothetical protein
MMLSTVSLPRIHFFRIGDSEYHYSGAGVGVLAASSTVTAAASGPTPHQETVMIQIIFIQFCAISSSC